MKTILASLSIAILALGSAPSDAGPAPWYQWRSKVNGMVVCSQTPLGSGWDRIEGAYKDSRCEKPVVAK
jgi:hypothetical protein